MNLKMSQNWGVEDTSDDRLSIQKNVVLFLTLNTFLIDITQRLTFELKDRKSTRLNSSHWW